MTAENQTVFTKEPGNNKLIVNRTFDAPVNFVWNAWTDPGKLDLWWAPRPWTAKTKSMDFREGGFWLYVMQGPEGEESWGRADYTSIVPRQYFTGTDSFCDANGNISEEIPPMLWRCEFHSAGSQTAVKVEFTFASGEDPEKLIELGLERGFTQATPILMNY